MWRFILALSEEDKQRRRGALDWYAEIAQLTALLPILLVALYRWTAIARARSQRSSVPGSPARKASKDNGFLLDSINRQRAPFLWWAGNPVYLFSYKLGTNAEVLGGSLWACWLAMLCVVGTGDDFFHVTKRWGIVGASQLPLHYLLAWKSSWSPIALATGLSWEELNRIHQVYGRIIVFFFSLHASFYLNAFIQLGVLLQRLQHLIIILGLFSIVSFLLLATTALDIVRQKNYRLFFVLHVTVATLILPTLYFHVHHIRPYIIESAIIYALGAALRQLSRREVTAKLTRLSPSLLEISVPKSELPSWSPGQHVYLTQGTTTFLPPNPFTIASLPTDDNLRLLLRVHKGSTVSLAVAARYSPLALHVEGPYGQQHLPRLAGCDTVLLLAAGVGMTFILPLHRSLHAMGRAPTLVWAVRRADDTVWAQGPYLAGAKMYLTSGAKDRQGDVAMTALLGEGDGFVRGRPDLRALVQDAFRRPGRVGVYVCGPAGMGAAVRREVARYVPEREVVFWDEQFGLS